MDSVEPRSDLAARELARGAEAIGFPLSAGQLAAFQCYIDTLLLWRTRLSLISTEKPEALVHHHVLDSLHVAPLVKTGSRVADLGSGAGFPGIPLAIACPESTFDLVESRRKKANFLREVVRLAGLGNVEVLEERAQSLATHRPGFYDAVVSRAVWRASMMLRIGAPLVHAGGLVIAMKGVSGMQEASAHEGFSGPDVITYSLNGNLKRLLLVYTKD